MALEIGKVVLGKLRLSMLSFETRETFLVKQQRVLCDASPFCKYSKFWHINIIVNATASQITQFLWKPYPCEQELGAINSRVSSRKRWQWEI